MMQKNNSESKSRAAFERAARVIAGGVNSPVRAYRSVGVQPPFIERGNGAKIYDIDGNAYIDYVCSWGALIAGHGHPAVIEAVRKAAEKGTSFGAPTLGEVELAEKIAGAYRSIDKIRMVSSGTEAVMSAVRLARGRTGKDLIVKMEGCYHGHSDGMLVSAGSGLAESSLASSAGVPEQIASATVVIPYNDVAAARAVFGMHIDKIAAVIVEPVAANMGVIPPADGYLQELRNLCDRNNAVLIFDEVITGFRLARGGAQEVYGVEADITCLGKIIGGGLPAAAFGGSTEIMDELAPDGPVYQAGTLSGNPVAVAAANATVDLLCGNGVYEGLEASAGLLEEGLSAAACKAGVPVRINRAGSLLSVFFTERPVRNFAEAKSADIKQFKRYFSQMLSHGIYPAPSAFEAMFVSIAHSREDIERTIEAGERSFEAINAVSG